MHRLVIKDRSKSTIAVDFHENDLSAKSRCYNMIKDTLTVMADRIMQVHEDDVISIELLKVTYGEFRDMFNAETSRIKHWTYKDAICFRLEMEAHRRVIANREGIPIENVSNLECLSYYLHELMVVKPFRQAA